MKYNLILLMFFWFCYFLNPNQVYAKGDYVPDTAIINEAIKNGRLIFNQNPDTAFAYWKKAENLIVKYVMYKQAKGEEIEKSLFSKLALVYTNQGRYYRNKGNPKEALNLSYKSLRILQNVNDYYTMALNYNNMGIIYQTNLKDDSSAIIMIKRAIDLFEKNNDSKNTLTMYANLAYIYEKRKNNKLAFKYLYKSMSYIPLTDDTSSISITYFRLGTIHLIINNLDSASYYLNKSLQLMVLTKNARGCCVCNYSLSKLALKQNNLVEAKHYALTSLNQAKSINFPSDVMSAYELLAEVYEKRNNWKESAKYRKNYSQLKDSIANIEFKDQLLKNQYSFEYKLKTLADSLKYVNKNKERELVISNQSEIIKVNNLLKVVYIVIFILILFVIFLIYRRLINKRKKNEIELKLMIIETEQNLKRALMNPHFLFNSLNAIQNLILINKQDEARNFLVKISKLMRLILDQSEKKTITLAEEVETLTLYFQMEQLRFGDGFEFEILNPNDFYMHEIKIPPLLIQPLVENAIIHGIRGIDKYGKIIVSLKKFDNHLECIVQDNGIGYNHSIFSGIPKSEHKSFGLGLLRSRLNFFNNKNIVENVLIIEDLNETNQSLSGTKITINIPLTIK